jgi:hypothetical protein
VSQCKGSTHGRRAGTVPHALNCAPFPQTGVTRERPRHLERRQAWQRHNLSSVHKSLKYKAGRISDDMSKMIGSASEAKGRAFESRRAHQFLRRQTLMAASIEEITKEIVELPRHQRLALIPYEQIKKEMADRFPLR